MPLDTKRLPVPENAVSLVKYRPSAIPPVVTGKEKRSDGRSPEDPRPQFVKTKPIPKARGSAYVEVGETKVICGVYGPRQVQRKEDFSMKGQLMCDFKFATFSCFRRRQHQPDSQEKECGRFIVSALEPAVLLDKFPKAQVDIFVTVLQNDGSALAASLTAASIAIADAGIEMYDIVIGTSARQINNITLIDPVGDEEDYVCQAEQYHGLTTMAYMPSLQQISGMVQDGCLQYEDITKTIDTLIGYSNQIHAVVENVLIKAVQEELAPER